MTLRLLVPAALFAFLAWPQGGYVITTVAGNGRLPFIGNGAPATSALLVIPEGITEDPAGNFVFCDSYYNRVFRVDSAGNITVLAGNGVGEFSGDGGPAIDAGLNGPASVVFDRQGRLVIADSVNGRVRRVESDGTIRTIAGGGRTTRGTGVAADTALFGFISGVAIDRAGLVVFSDANNSQVWRIDANGNLVLLAGAQNRRGYGGDGGPATEALLSGPDGLAFDGDGNLFIADSFNHAIRRVTPAGTISSIAGNGQFGTAGDNIPAAQAQLGFPTDLAFDSTGALLFCEFATSRIRRIAGGVLTTLADSARIPQLSGPTGIAITPSGVVLAVAQVSRLILRVTGNLAPVAAGFSTNQAPGDGGLAIAAHILDAQGVTRDGLGNLFVSDFVDHRIRMVRAADQRISTTAGNGTSGLAGDGGPAINATLGRPRALTVNNLNEVLFSFATGSGVRRFVPGGNIFAFAGGGQLGFSGDNGPATQALFNGVDGIALDSQGAVYLPDAFNHRLRRVVQATVSTIAGTGTEGYAGDSALAVNARLSLPSHAVVDSNRNIYVLDSGNRVVRRIDPQGVIRTWFGSPGSGITGDPGPSGFTGLAIDRQNNLYITSTTDSQIFRVSGTQASVIAGNLQSGFSGDGGDALRASLASPTYIWVDPDGSVYFTDSGNARVRKLQPVAELPPALTNAASFQAGPVAAGEIVTFFPGRDAGPQQLAGAVLDEQGRIATELAGTRVFFEEFPAPLVYTQARQISAIVPFAMAGRASAAFRIEFNGEIVVEGRVQIVPAAPGIFTLAGGIGQAAMINEDGSFNTPNTRAPVGSVVAFFVAGAGETDPPGQDGRLATGTIPRPLAELVVTIGGVAAEVVYAANAPGLVEGLIQINARVDPRVAPGVNVPVLVRYGNVQSQAAVTMSVR